MLTLHGMKPEQYLDNLLDSPCSTTGEDFPRGKGYGMENHDAFLQERIVSIKSVSKAATLPSEELTIDGRFESLWTNPEAKYQRHHRTTGH